MDPPLPCRRCQNGIYTYALYGTRRGEEFFAGWGCDRCDHILKPMGER